MPDTTFESISDAGRAIVAAHKKKKGFEEGIRKLLSELYPDNAHFIYELLQNAEDAKASAVEFELHDTALEVRHNGTRLFTLNDIDSITNIGDSTKKDDPTQIGKFGVGFKAVYSYTSRPEVRSGEYSFAIEDLFINQRIDGDAPPGLTTFRFPFDRAEKPPSVATSEVARGLAELDEKTLLFLNNVSVVTYALPDGTVGIIERKERDGVIITIQKSQGDRIVESHWLRLVGPATVENLGPMPLSVGAAFALEYDERPKRKKSTTSGSVDSLGTEQARPRSIVPLEKGDVCIYFPAAKETSGLRFHIHAPFASTVARDSVRDESGNTHLVGDIGDMIVRALPLLRDEGLIDDSFLATLPNQGDAIGWPYSLIQHKVEQAFNRFAITPARASGYAPANELVASPVEFRNFLAESDLPLLLELAGIIERDSADTTRRWIRTRDGRAGKFLASLDTIEFTWVEMKAILTTVGASNSHAIPDWLEWLSTKSDEEIANLYQLLGSGRSSGQIPSWYAMTDIPIIRLISRHKVAHVRGPETYLPANRTDSVQTRVPIKLAYFDDDDDEARANNLRAFYKATGVRRWDESARIQARLKSYSYTRPIPEGDDVAKHLNDVRAFARFARSNPQDAANLFKGVPFLLSPNPEGDLDWVAPKETFLDTPFVTTGFSALYAPKKSWFGDQEDEYEWEAADRSPVAGIYLDIVNISDFLELVGSQARVEIRKSNDVFHPRNPQLKLEWWANNRHSAYTEMVDWDIKQLDQIIATSSPDLLRTLWLALVESKADPFSAVYRANNSARRYVYESRLVQKLKSTRWLLDRGGELKLPSELTVDDLREDWPRPAANSPVHKLGFGAIAAQHRQRTEGVKAFLREEGIDEELLDIMREVRDAGVAPSELRATLDELAASKRFPEASSDDPDRRFAVAAQDALDAPAHQAEFRLRSVVDGQGQASAESKAYLVGQYTTSGGEMFCQACHKLLPFKVNGRWYFESVRFVAARKQVHPANAVALCPLCAALYKNTRGTSNEDLLEALAKVTIGQGQGAIEIPVLLDNKRVVVRFTGKHAIDLQAALGVAGDPRSGSQP